ncbi:hypothetical protein HYALB_00010447 [Hymenoscyphus albidus]|uniref:PCI domain-containing protein n=1 Tax=Hymenoscyphus albidus TaxID=595503 RepID=A0A9N9LER5_9HELO|nr:hypothetical protein HYALB_00010447 [Hymenoscyphus albidus]
MEQTKALNALEPFLALTKSATSPRAAADLITRATSTPNTFIFSELLSTPQIQSLSASPEYSSHLTLLQIFSYGTYNTYQTTPNLHSLNTAQLLKLRQLTFLSLARTPSHLTYGKLMGELGMANARELEDLVISAIYAGLVMATLDPYHQVVHISSLSPLRDLQPNSIPGMISTLNSWSLRCDSTLADLENQIAGIKAAALQRHREEVEWAAEVERLGEKGKLESVGAETKGGLGSLVQGLGRKLGGGKRGAAADGEEDYDMDVDEDEEEVEGRRNTRSAKKRGFGGFGK